mgnify:CR=1 FL=1
MKTQSVSKEQSSTSISKASPSNEWRPHRILEEVAILGFVIIGITLYIAEVAK